MRRGEMGPVMYLVIALIALLAIIILIMKVSGKSWGIIEFIQGVLP
jgi:hypothetical protein